MSPSSQNPEPATQAATMTVTVRDRGAEAPWGYGPTSPVTRQITISAYCQYPECGARRGEPRGLNQHDDGVWYWTQVWTNPCGHLDAYPAVLAEARALTAAPLSPEREKQIRALGGDDHRTVFVLDKALGEVLAELDRTRAELAARPSHRQIEHLRVQRDDLAAAAKRAGESLQHFINDSADPGSEALGAQYELGRLLANLDVIGAVVSKSEYLSRFSVTPAEIDRHLRRRIAEDVYLNYQRAIGNAAVSEAVLDAKHEAAETAAVPLGDHDGWIAAAQFMDPTVSGPYPAQLLCSQHNGFGPCPGAPRCTPRDDEGGESRG